MNARVSRCEHELFAEGDVSEDESCSLSPLTKKSANGGGLEARINRILDERMGGGFNGGGLISPRGSPKKAAGTNAQDSMFEILVGSHISEIVTA